MSVKPAVALLAVLLAGACARSPAPADPARPPAAETRTDGDRSQTGNPEASTGETSPEAEQPRQTPPSEPARSEPQSESPAPADNSSATNSAMEADKVETVRFAPGASSAAVSGSIAGFALHDYIVQAFAGQILEATMRSDGPALLIVIENEGYQPDDIQGVPAAESQSITPPGSAQFEGWRWRGTLPADGEYRVRVAHSGSAANAGSVSDYSLEIKIE